MLVYKCSGSRDDDLLLFYIVSFHLVLYSLFLEKPDSTPSTIIDSSDIRHNRKCPGQAIMAALRYSPILTTGLRQSAAGNVSFRTVWTTYCDWTLLAKRAVTYWISINRFSPLMDSFHSWWAPPARGQLDSVTFSTTPEMNGHVMSCAVAYLFEVPYCGLFLLFSIFSSVPLLKLEA